MADKKKVLLVEDDSTLNELTSEMIQIMGYEVVSAESKAEAIEKFNKSHQEIGLAIFDMNLEDATGYEVFAELNKIDANYAAVLASGMVTEFDVKVYKEAGFKEAISKPYSMNDLQRILSTYLD